MNLRELKNNNMSILRDITQKTAKYWLEDEILIFVGARQAGKTTILKQIQLELENQKQLCYFLNLEDPEYLSLLNEHPKNLFKIFSFDQQKKNFVFIDEIQYLKNPSNFLKYIFDEHKSIIKLIVSGSSAFYMDKKFKDSLAGRKRIFQVPTLSFQEFLRFKNEEHLSKLNFKNLGLAEKNKISLLFREFMLFGGYPKVVLSPLAEKENILREIAFSYIKKDIYEADIKQDDVFYKLFKILASQIGNLVNNSELANTLGISKTAIMNYLYVMQKSFHLILIKPLFKNKRKEITKMPKAYFLDLGLRNFFAGNFQIFDSREDNGQILENAFLRQLMENIDAEEINFWRSLSQKEVDFIVKDTAYEVKLNPEKVNFKDIKAFLEIYPKTDFSIISIDAKIKTARQYPVMDIWEI